MKILLITATLVLSGCSVFSLHDRLAGNAQLSMGCESSEIYNVKVTPNTTISRIEYTAECGGKTFMCHKLLGYDSTCKELINK
jgi:hypothetical protein